MCEQKNHTIYTLFSFCELTKQHCFTGTADLKNVNNALNDFPTRFGSLLVGLCASCMEAHFVFSTACHIFCMYKKGAPRN